MAGRRQVRQPRPRGPARRRGQHHGQVACPTSAAQPGDTTAPTAPANLAAGTPSTTSIPLTWSASTDAGSGVAGYQVYRGTTLVGSTTSTSLTVTGLTADTAYSFSVRAKDVAGNVSAASTASPRGRPSAARDRHRRAERPDGSRGRHGDDDVDPAALDRVHRQLRWLGRGRLRRLPGGHAGRQQHDAELHRHGPGRRDVVRVHGRGEGRRRQPVGRVHGADRVHGARRGHRLVRGRPTRRTAGAPGSPARSGSPTPGTTRWPGGRSAFTFANGQKVTQGWSATCRRPGPPSPRPALAWNSTLAPGASTEIGFNGSHTGTNTAPTAFTVNGAACTVRVTA